GMQSRRYNQQDKTFENHSGWTKGFDDMIFNCPQCQQSLDIDDVHAGRDIQCPACGRYITVPGAAPSAPPIVPDGLIEQSRSNIPNFNRNTPQDVRVVDVKMPFGSMVIFMIKWALAAIPAMIILVLLYFLVMGMILGGCMSAMMSMK
ncbi:MAG TPA: hypothetical protein PKE12_15720, partial [Kiritimatiellia bacterium]|nr:hypothetical protein [Kiritimatiellia bacterium]